MRDVILLQGIRVPSALGVTPAEREMRRPVDIDLELEVDLQVSGSSDRIEDTIDYAAVYEVVEKVAGSGEHRLVEALATRIAEALLTAFPIDSCSVTLLKPTPVSGSLTHAGVRIRRDRGGPDRRNP